MVSRPVTQYMRKKVNNIAIGISLTTQTKAYMEDMLKRKRWTMSEKPIIATYCAYLDRLARFEALPASAVNERRKLVKEFERFRNEIEVYYMMRMENGKPIPYTE